MGDHRVQPPAPESPLLSFYRGTAPDSHGRTIEEILAWPDARLEEVHDFIQWLFPLAEGSAFNPHAPIVTPEDARSFRQDAALQARLTKAFDRFLRFLGLECRRAGLGLEVVRGARFADRREGWLYPGSHNFLRLTRVLKSLRLLGLEDHAWALFVFLESIHRECPQLVGDVPYGYWRDAITGRGPKEGVDRRL